jgi:hypothetical protein
LFGKLEAISEHAGSVLAGSRGSMTIAGWRARQLGRKAKDPDRGTV